MTELIGLVKKNVEGCEDIYNLLLEFSIELKINCDLKMINIGLQDIISEYYNKIEIIKEKIYPYNQKKRKIQELIKQICDHPNTLVKSEREWDGHRGHTHYYCNQCNTYVRCYKISKYE